MADRTSAGIFGDVFIYLASQPKSPERDAFALEVWCQSQGNYDFSNYQMGADKALIELGLARRGVDPAWPDDGEVVLYGPVTP
jgi:hypothetical protein